MPKQNRAEFLTEEGFSEYISQKTEQLVGEGLVPSEGVKSGERGKEEGRESTRLFLDIHYGLLPSQPDNSSVTG